MKKSEKVLAGRRKLEQFQNRRAQKLENPPKGVGEKPRDAPMPANSEPLSAECNWNPPVSLSIEEPKAHSDPNPRSGTNANVSPVREEDTKKDARNPIQDVSIIDHFDSLFKSHNPEATGSIDVLGSLEESGNEKRNEEILNSFGISRTTVDLENHFGATSNFSVEVKNDDGGGDNVAAASAAAAAGIDAGEIATVLPKEPEEPVRLETGEKREFLNVCLEEKDRVSDRLNFANQKIFELESALARKTDELTEKIQENTNLRKELEVHSQTTKILVGEKAELGNLLEQNETLLKQRSVELENVTTKYRQLQIRVNELEKELISTKALNEDTRKDSIRTREDYDELSKKFLEVRKEKEDLEEESSELRQKLAAKNSEFVQIEKELQEKVANLSLCELKIQQLTSAPIDSRGIEDQQKFMASLESRLNEAQEKIKSLQEEKEEAHKQYENYVRQLDTRQSKLLQELESKRKSIGEFENREESYVKRLSDLELQLQREKDRVNSLLHLQDQQERIEMLTKNIDELTLAQERLHIVLSEKETDIEALRKELQEVGEAKGENVETSKLVSALESEQLGASRAVSQNQQLKQQLAEMHDAFVVLSNTKLDLTEQLQAERSIGRKMNAQLNKTEEEIARLQRELTEKESKLEELEKQRFQTAQITDQMQHYQAQAHHAGTLQAELQKAFARIEDLKVEKEHLLVELKSLRNPNPPLPSDTRVPETSPKLENGVDHPQEVESPVSQDSPAPELPGDEKKDLGEENLGSEGFEPLKKLEQRFKEAMERVAELTDEKQRLEHLVLQLQSETETVGEYVTLYQSQRAVLQERTKQKEKAFQRFMEQHGQQQEQLHRLKILVADLLRKRSSTERKPGEDEDRSAVIEEGLSLQGKEKTTPESGVSENGKVEELPIKDKTTSELLDLLTEIKDCKDACYLEPNFHPCPWCSGKLITI